MSRDVPYLNVNDIRGLFYVKSINQELSQEEPATISQLAEASEWRSNYFTRLWKSLAPELINKVKDGSNTRLELTEHGRKAVSKYEELNEIFEVSGYEE